METVETHPKCPLLTATAIFNSVSPSTFTAKILCFSVSLLMIKNNLYYYKTFCKLVVQLSSIHIKLIT